MESELETEVKKGLENPEVDRDLKAEETNNLSTNSCNDPMIESVAELCEMYGYELAASDPPIKSNHILENDSNDPLQPSQSQQTGGSELKNKLVEAVAAVFPQQATSTYDRSSNGAQARQVEPFESSNNFCTMKVEDSEAAEEFGVGKELNASEALTLAEELEGNWKTWKAAEGPADDSVIPSDKYNDCDQSDSGPSSTSDEVPCVQKDPRSFMNRLNSKLALWKDCEGVCPPEIEQIIRESDSANSASQEVNSAESMNTSEWQNMNYSEKMTFVSFRQAGIPREEAVAKINEILLERGIPILTRRISSQEVASQSSHSAETCPKTEDRTQKVADKTQKLKLDLKGEELKKTFRELRRIGLPRKEAWARIQESRAILESCEQVNVWNEYKQTIQDNLADSRARKMNRVKKRLTLAKQKKKDRANIFSRFNRKQKSLYKEMREKDKTISHPDAMNKVIEMSEKLGIINISLANLLSARGPGTSTASVINHAQIDGTSNVPTSGDSAVSNCQKTMDGPENIAESNEIGECCKRCPEYSDFISGLVRDPDCKYSLDKIIQMAERIPESHGIYAKKLFILRCYKFGVDPEGWDWKQYSEIPPFPKTLNAPPSHSQNRTINQQKCKQPSCIHASCKYYSAPLEPQHRQGSSRAENVGVRNDSFRPHLNGIPPLMVRDEPGSSSYGKSSYDESREAKRIEFMEEPSADFLPDGTQPRPAQDLHLYIVPIQYPSELLDDEEMCEIENSILDAIFKIHDERMRPIFNGSFHNNGRYEVICQDQFSKEWLYKYVSCLSPSASLKIIPAELSKTSAVPSSCNIYQNHETRYSHDPGFVTTCSSISHDQGSRERLVYVDLSPHAHPSSSKRNLQDRLGPKNVSPYGRDSSMHVSRHDEPLAFRCSYSPKYSGEPSEYTDPSWDVSSSSARNFDERIRCEVTRSPSVVYNRSRYIEPSLHDDIRRETDVFRSWYSNYRDFGDHSEYVEPSEYTKRSSSYRDSIEGYDTNLVVTRSRSLEYNSSRYIEPPLEPPRSYSPDYADYKDRLKRYSVSSWRDETPNDHYSGHNSGRHHLRSPIPEYRASRNRSGYYESSHDYGSQSPDESRSDARERLKRIRTNRTSANVERGRSPPESSHSSRPGHQDCLRSPPPYSKSASRTNRSKYNPRQYSPPPSFSRHFSKNL